jgi:CheY-like chemotaxis protein
LDKISRHSVEEPPMTCIRPARPLSVLVVDDDEDTADSYALLLCLNGHDARAAYDGTQAMEQLRGWQPSAALLDIMLPGCDGVALRERLCREMPKRPRVIAVTGLTAPDGLERVRAAGFDRVLVKPVDPDELLRVLQGG